MIEKLGRRDWILIAACVAVAAISLFIIFNWFYAAFPEASIEFRVDRDSSLPIAQKVLDAQRIDVKPMKHAALFTGDDTAKIFLERTVGLANANQLMRSQVRLWWWQHRWFKPLEEEEYAVDVAPTGEIVGFSDRIPEQRALPAVDVATARANAEAFLTRVGVKLADLQLVTQSERTLPSRVQRIFTWDSQSIHPGGAPYRTEVTVDGDRVSSYSQRIKVPDQWQRDYVELRSKNNLAGQVDTVFFIITFIAAVVIFIIRLLRGDMRIKLLLGVAVASVILVTGTSLNSFPSAVASYDTTTSYPAFLAEFVFLRCIMSGVGVAMLLAVIVGSGEVLYRERLPQHLAIPRLWTRKALASKRVFLSFVIGFALVGFFIAYQVAFYLVADRFGAWSPAEVPYDDTLNTAFPWIAVLFAGFFPSLSEEFASRAFSIPFFEKVFRSRLFAIVLAGFIWGFGHATYPNQPFFIRGLEVGLAGCMLGFLLFRFGLLPLLIWHYSVDAIYTALLLFRSGNTYYIVSGALASLVFAIPMLISIALYIRNKGFVTDEDLSNASLPMKPAPQTAALEEAPVAYPPAESIPRNRWLAAIAVVAIVSVLVALRPASPDDAVDYRTTGGQALAAAAPYKAGTKNMAAPTAGFRPWESQSGREDGGSPGGFDSTALDYLLHHGMSMKAIVNVLTSRIETGTWMVRSFTPLQKDESFTEVDARTGKVIGYHRLQDEKRVGARLEKADALAIATNAFPRFGADVRAFDLKEALAFQQPNRRDWLFHFQERAPLAAAAFRRISVRVQGSQVTQFTTTIKIPEEAYREAEQTNFLNVVVSVLRVIGAIAVLSLIVAGFVMAARKHFPWRRPARLAAMLAIIPIVMTIVRFQSSLFLYDTSISWETFVNQQVISAIVVAGFQIGILFLALSGIDAARPQALDWLRREGRARFGRAALVGALIAIGAVAIARAVLQWVMQLFPSIAPAGGVSIPQSVNAPLPALLAIGQAVFLTIASCASIALFVAGLRGMPRGEKYGDVVGVIAIFCLLMDPSAHGGEIALMMLSAAAGAALLWFLVRHVLRDNLLAYPIAIALSLLLTSAATLLQNERQDLIGNGIVVIVAAVAIAAWMAIPGRTEHA